MMINFIVKYVTPLRVGGIIFLIITIVLSIQINQQLNNEYEPGLGGLFPIVTGAISIGAFVIDFILSLMLSTKRKMNFLIQTVIIVISFIWIYWPNWILNIEIPNSFTGELLIVYDFENGEKLPLGLFGTGDKLKVPSNGVIFTSSKFLANHNNTIYFDDTGIKWGIHGDYESKFDLPPVEDTVFIENKGYLFQAIPIRNLPSVNYGELESRLDSLKLRIKQQIK